MFEINNIVLITFLYVFFMGSITVTILPMVLIHFLWPKTYTFDLTPDEPRFTIIEIRTFFGEKNARRIFDNAFLKAKAEKSNAVLDKIGESYKS